MRHKKGMVCMMVQKSSTKVRDMMHINWLAFEPSIACLVRPAFKKGDASAWNLKPIRNPATSG